MKCIVFGAGKSGKNYIQNIGDKIEIVAVVDNAIEKWGTWWLGENIGYLIENPSIIAKKEFDFIIICSCRYEDIEEQLILTGVSLDKIIYEESIYEYKYNEFYFYKIWRFYNDIHSVEILTKIMLREYRYSRLRDDDRLLATEYIMIKGTNRKYDKNLSALNDKIRYLEMNCYGNLEKMCTDKYMVRKYVEYLGLGKILPELYFAISDIDDLKEDMFPQEFAFKLNNGCGYNYICKDKANFDVEMLKIKARRWELRKIEMLAYEWHYENIKKKYICEQLLKTADGGVVKDYKYFCCNGKIECILVCVDRDLANGESYHYYFDQNWNELEYAVGSVRQIPSKKINQPVNLDKMNSYAEKLAGVFPFVRVDLYNIDGNIFFGELTFTPCGGLITIQSEEAQKTLADKIDVDYKKGENERYYKLIYNVD